MGMAAEPQFHVLVVDDSSTDRKLMERLLMTSSYQVTTVDSGSKALEFLGLQEDDEQSNRTLNQTSVSPGSQQVSFPPRKKEVEVHLIITDYCMPGMTGYDLLKKVKESSAFRNIPVVIMSSEEDPSRISRCLEEGAEEFFTKPVQLADVNRLRPHMLRAKHGQQHKQDLLQECQKPEQKPEQQQQLQQQRQPHPEVGQQQTEQNNNNNNNKRKSLDEGLSPDRTRPRYNSGLTTVV